MDASDSKQRGYLNGNNIAGLVADARTLEVKLKVPHLLLALLSSKPLVPDNT